LTQVELEQLADLAAEIEQSAGGLTVMIEKAIAVVDRPVDEATMCERTAARLRVDPVALDLSLLDCRETPGNAWSIWRAS